jgi:hypothetical protein
MHRNSGTRYFGKKPPVRWILENNIKIYLTEIICEDAI